MLKMLRQKIREFINSFWGNDDSRLEAEHRRRDARTSIERKIKHIWDAHKKPPAMERLLQQFAPRTQENERIQQAKAKRTARNTLVSRFAHRFEYDEIVVPFFSAQESDAYFQLRKPENKPHGVSIDYWLGLQNGKLEVIEDFRLMISTAIFELNQDRARAKVIEDQKNKYEATK